MAASPSPEARARLNEVLEDRVVFEQVSRDVTEEMSLNKTIKVRIRHPRIVSSPAILKKTILESEREARNRGKKQYGEFAEELEDEEAGPRFREYEEA